MACHACGPDHPDSACPFAFTEASECVQNLGCLPTAVEIINMRVYHGKTWACHDDLTKPCVGAIRALQEKGLPYSVEDPELLTESSPWHLYVGETNG